MTTHAFLWYSTTHLWCVWVCALDEREKERRGERRDRGKSYLILSFKSFSWSIFFNQLSESVDIWFSGLKCKSLSRSVKNTQKKGIWKHEVWEQEKMSQFFKIAYLGSSHSWYRDLWLPPSKSPVPAFSLPPDFALPVTNMTGPSSALCDESRAQQMWLALSKVGAGVYHSGFSSSCFYTLSLNSDVGGSE